jgi:hypothetical protein
MLYLLPFMMVEAAGQGADGLQMVAQEIQAVMQVCWAVAVRSASN